MLKLQEFIVKNSDWRSKLAEAPYYITIKEDNNLIIFSYNLVKGSDFTNPIVRECRGIILEKESWDVVCRGFDKFGNYGESYVPELDWYTATVTEKIDGSLIKVFWYQDEWRIATNNSIDAFAARIEEARYSGSFGDLFLKTFEKKYGSFDKSLNKDRVTYLFELVSPCTQIVVPYAEPDIFYLGCRNNITGIETAFFEENFNFKTPKTYSLTSLEAVQKAAATLPHTEEGYVVVDKNYNRCKIKSPEYVMAHHMINNNQISKRKLIEIINCGDEEEFLIYCPAFRDEIKKLKGQRQDYNNYLINVVYTIEQFGFARGKTKKEFIEWLKTRSFDPFTFQFLLYWYDYRNLTFKEWTSKWSLQRWETFYNLKGGNE